MEEFRGKVVVAVNVACRCGYTKDNYAQLSELLNVYHPSGLRVVLFPCNQFANQEPGSDQEIHDFAHGYNEKFIVTEKINVNGSEANPLWQWLKEKQGGTVVDAVKWNFTKFLIDRDGMPVARHGPSTQPKSFEAKVKELLDKPAVDKAQS